MDDRNETIGKKIRNAQLEKLPYMLVIGDKEVAEETVAVRSRREGDLGTHTADELLSRIILPEVVEKRR